MISNFVIGVTSLLAINSAEIKEDLKTSNKDVCTVTCTVSVPDGFGGTVGVSGTAGNWFTSCESARETACRRAWDNVHKILMDM